MKKYFFNPYDIFISIIIISFSLILIGFLTIMLIFDLYLFPSNDMSLSLEILVSIIILYLIFLTTLILGLLYINKYKGYIYPRDDHILLKKGKKIVKVEPNNIKWIEIKHDLRSGLKKGFGKNERLRFSIRLYNEKENLDFIITNNIILDIIKKYNVRIMPDQYNDIYLKTGNFDFISKSNL